MPATSPSNLAANLAASLAASRAATPASASTSPTGGLSAVAPSSPGAGAGALALVEGEMEAVETALAARMESSIGRIPEVGAHLLQAGGKRLRPLLAVLAARASDAPIELAIAVGVAGELIHTATLYHDDVVDDGRVRRGRPAARMVYGNGIVVLVGDFCLARALETVALTGSLPAVQSLAATVTEMAEGEVAQLERAGNPEASVDDYFRVIDRKTASLISWCARVGGGVGAKLDAALNRYGRALGRAFQIADDVLDCASSEDSAGKSVGRDIQEGKLTLPVLYACESDAALRALVRAKIGETAVSPADAASILGATRVGDADGLLLEPVRLEAMP
jgi:octaprenyl-diphosphate synthase